MVPKKGVLNLNVDDFDLRQKSCHVLEQQYCYLVFFSGDCILSPETFLCT